MFLLGAFDEDPLGKTDDDTYHNLKVLYFFKKIKLESAMMKIGSDNTMSFYAASDETMYFVIINIALKLNLNIKGCLIMKS